MPTPKPPLSLVEALQLLREVLRRDYGIEPVSITVKPAGKTDKRRIKLPFPPANPPPTA